MTPPTSRKLLQTTVNLRKQCIGMTRGGRNTKMHAVVDALENPIHVQLSSGDVIDSSMAQELWSHIKLKQMKQPYLLTRRMDLMHSGSTLLTQRQISASRRIQAPLIHGTVTVSYTKSGI